MQLFYFQYKQKNIFLKVEIGKEVPSNIYTDDCRLRQVLMNLLGNAFKFTFKGGVMVRVAQDPECPDSLLVAVSDTGVGIRDNDKNKLFKIYGKLDDRENINRNGVGLGLAISNTLAALLGGQTSERGIEMTSAYGLGTTFWFKLKKNLRQFLDEHGHVQKTEVPIMIILEKEDGSLEEEADVLDDEDDVSEEIFPSEREDSSSPNQFESKLASFRFLMPPGLPEIDTPNESLMDDSPSTARKFFFDKSVRKGPSKSNFSSQFMNMGDINISVERSSKQKNYILVVDDNPFNLLVADNYIKEAGFHCKVAKNGLEAIELVKSDNNGANSFKVIFMDCEMPIMDGFEATKILRERMDKDEISKIPIVALTSHGQDDEIKKCLECGMVDFLPKPLTLNALMSVLSKLNVNFSSEKIASRDSD